MQQAELAAGGFDLFAALHQQVRHRPLQSAQLQRIRITMHACGVSSIRNDDLLFELRRQRLSVFRMPADAAGEPTPI